MNDMIKTIHPKLDLVFERIVDVPVELIWKAWTVPEHLMVWFCPKPWQTTECEINLRPGGLFRTVMRSPEGEELSGRGCYLEIVENKKLIWTDALEENYRPNEKRNDCFDGFFTGILLLDSLGDRTKYTAIARHANEKTCKLHSDRGFEAGWGTALDQLVAYVKTIS